MRLPILVVWFSLLLILNVLDIYTTVPAYEINPVTLYTWAVLGFDLAAWSKIGLVLLFGMLCLAAWKLANPSDWMTARKLLLNLMIALVIFYAFVVSANIMIFTM